MTSDQFGVPNVPAPSPAASSVAAPPPYAPAVRPERDDARIQRRLTLVTVALGAYLTYFAFSGQIVTAFLGRGVPGSYSAILVIQAIIALGVLVLGWSFAPTSAARRLAAVVTTLVLVVVAFAIALLRLSGAPFGPSGIPISLTVGNVPFVLVIAVAVGWLTVRERSPLAYIFVLAAGVLPFAQYTMLVQGVEAATTQIVLMLLSAAVFVGVAWIGRAVSGPSVR